MASANLGAPRAYAWGMYGMLGQAADPQNFEHFCRRVAAEGIDVRHSPYRDYQTQAIVDDVMSVPADAIKFVFGASLGANNSPVIVKALNGHRIVHGIFGFQASGWPGAGRVPIESNCRFARLSTNPNVFETFGLSAYVWVVVDNTKTELHVENTNDPHPGDGNVAMQDMFLTDMTRIITAAANAPAAGAT